jgi:hypothetical protein
VKSKWKTLLGVTMALVLNVTFASAALAHGASPTATRAPNKRQASIGVSYCYRPST